MKILITGSSGYIGKEFINNFSDKYEIMPFDLAEGSDILNFEQLDAAMKGCDIVIHLAAIHGPDEKSNFEDYFQTNCQGTLNVSRCAVKNKIKRLIYASSTGYYGLENGIPYVKPIKESNPVVSQYAKLEDLHCRDCDLAYSTSKVIAEQILANYGLMKKIEVIILRLAPIGGRPGERWAVDGISLKIENALNAINAAVISPNELWYEAFNIADPLDNVDISKARNILMYDPKI
ncbi:MAG: NAD(P)-dependent oxidoreductase [Candidatus Pacebacteria bacterium]|jgi:nucleoside-diphosphate-sugar epimerase|nr:NAD(P)-dependent oxidoreductase [Candidatus Paceibacterota bacterium]